MSGVLHKRGQIDKRIHFLAFSSNQRNMIYTQEAIATVCADARSAVTKTVTGLSSVFRKMSDMHPKIQMRALRFMACDAKYDPNDASKVTLREHAAEFNDTFDVPASPLLDGAFTCGDSPFAFKLSATAVLGGSFGLFVVRHRAEASNGKAFGTIERTKGAAREVLTFVEDNVETAMRALMSGVRRVGTARHEEFSSMLELVNRYALGYGNAFTATRLREMGCAFLLGAQSWAGGAGTGTAGTAGKAMFATTLDNAVVLFAVTSPEALCKVFEAKDHLDVVVRGLKAYAELLAETCDALRQHGTTFVDIASVAEFTPEGFSAQPELALPLRMATSSTSELADEEPELPAPKRMRGSVPPPPPPCKAPSTPQQRHGTCARQLTL